ncbi:polysaccharide biosynthesis protein [Fodinibius sediminis]|uniref:NDP-sugar epimerase, includes UDP-GlcNAc-inverting 4,6-dehydratase FlaA1 and capsular polysaccharide biosynthesis protein EpsC n=1 Tax=Fodinibius sediminis TaxID=1214077 RepID=A0A521B2W5_9BACT|nr:nucleoside-diphosphate sugar epimerase/dehydratase [Fodinibius sediminis]SMO41376.1 NDP-sugar epimerase, includes UDP-GlcNAc-inverting 4,6-dehydratase FlaA1 and capsular polysaccharide biosynthesis protein EpsC [Fodinibius sediminis]
MSGNHQEIESYKDKYKYRNKFTRGLFFLIGDAVLLLLSASFAYMILSPFVANVKAFPVQHTMVIVGSVLAGLTICKMYMVTWRYTSLGEMVRIVLAVIFGGMSSLVIMRFLQDAGNYEYAFTTLTLTSATLGIGGFRISKRMYCEFVNPSKKNKKHTIIYGGESMGEQILRDILRNDQWDLSVYGVFDDRTLPGLLLHGVRNLGGREEMINHIRQYPVKLLIIAFPEIPKKDLKKLVDEVKEIRPDMDIKVLPSFHSLTDDPVGVRHIRDVSIEDILGREPVEIDMDSIKASIQGKTVLVTGAGGSIGSELIRQCASLGPQKLIALDIDETELFYLENEFKDRDTTVIPYVGSITDESKMDQIFGKIEPDVIFHAAAYKHVPMMESFPEEAIKVNVGGTYTLASLACKHEVDKFVMVSTDKAVNPTNVMGATKRIAEEVCMAQNGTCLTKFISVRFGNVLGSRGSVVPLFIEQINNGGPVTVTDPRMKRYFMTIPEAVLLVMQAGSMGQGGEVFVLDMGEPVKILDMAKELIRLHNLEPGKDIQIQITGLRPGEKLFEELLNAEEGVTETRHKEIFKAVCSRKVTTEELEQKISDLLHLLENGNTPFIREHLKEMVPTYSYKEMKKFNGSVRATTDRSLLAG